MSSAPIATFFALRTKSTELTRGGRGSTSELNHEPYNTTASCKPLIVGDDSPLIGAVMTRTYSPRIAARPSVVNASPAALVPRRRGTNGLRPSTFAPALDTSAA